jgi:hypothetical protein
MMTITDNTGKLATLIPNNKDEESADKFIWAEWPWTNGREDKVTTSTSWYTTSENKRSAELVKFPIINHQSPF